VSNPAVIHVHPLSEVRQRLSGILSRFRREGPTAEPVVFGSHRKPEAIILPYEEYELLTRQRQRMIDAMDVIQSVQIELPGPFSPEHDQAVAAYIAGEIDADQAYRRVLALYRPEQ
jgi:PHD/YefM family antitoxin component YafN of YafNO toxin-antitoxin module